MIPLRPPTPGAPLRAWRLDRERHAAAWNSGLGASLVGGRWNPVGRAAIYMSLDPATAILEVAVHRGFAILDTEPHVLTCADIAGPKALHVVDPKVVPNPNWLRPGPPTAGQQEFGRALLDEHGFVLVPSVVSSHCWNLVVDPGRAASVLAPVHQERFALDPRLPPRPT